MEPLREKDIIVGQTWKQRMESFIRERELKCGLLQPHSPLWELFHGQKEKMSRSMARWDQFRVRGDELWYRHQIRFVDEAIRVLGPEEPYWDPEEVGA